MNKRTRKAERKKKLSRKIEIDRCKELNICHCLHDVMSDNMTTFKEIRTEVWENNIYGKIQVQILLCPKCNKDLPNPPVYA